jgi:tRNA G18 (ribose-2'-O)-methylase SpoU
MFGRTVTITDLDDPRLSPFIELSDASARDRHNVFVVEGETVLRQALGSNYRVRSVLVDESKLATLDRALQSAGAVVYVAPHELLEDVDAFPLHRGVMAVVERGEPLDMAEVLGTARRVVMCEHVANPDNVGAVFRLSAAFGVDAVLISPDTSDPLYRKALRVSQGWSMRVPFVRVSPWPEQLLELRSRGFTTIALSQASVHADIATVATKSSDRVAIAVGSEGKDLTWAAQAVIDHFARLPIAEEVGSLNVATALAIALYELR